MLISFWRFLLLFLCGTLLLGAAEQNRESEIAAAKAPPQSAQPNCDPQPCKPCCVPAKVCPMPVCEPPCYDPCCGPKTYYNHNINPSARCTDNENGIILDAEFLWWTAGTGGIPFAFVNTGNTIGVQSGYIAHLDNKWKPGLRVGLGWNTSYDGWDLFADWTWYKNSSKSSVHEDPSGTGPRGVHLPFLSFTSSGAKADPIFAAASAHWRLNYNVLDLELGKSFYISCKLIMRPYIGVKGGWVHRKYSASYLTADVPANANIYSAKSNFWGVGPRFGLNTDWKAGAGFLAFGNISGAFLYGKTSKNNEVTVAISGTGSTTTLSSLSNSDNWRMIPTAQMIVGLGWGRCFNCGKMYFGVRAGWEVNYFWDLPGFVNQDGNQAVYTVGRNLDLTGLTVDFRIEF